MGEERTRPPHGIVEAATLRGTNPRGSVYDTRHYFGGMVEQAAIVSAKRGNCLLRLHRDMHRFDRVSYALCVQSGISSADVANGHIVPTACRVLGSGLKPPWHSRRVAGGALSGIHRSCGFCAYSIVLYGTGRPRAKHTCDNRMRERVHIAEMARGFLRICFKGFDRELVYNCTMFMAYHRPF